MDLEWHSLRSVRTNCIEFPILHAIILCHVLEKVEGSLVAVCKMA